MTGEVTDRVLLYSGGMDSVALSMIERWDTRLYVDMGTAYSAAERSRLDDDVVVVDLPLGVWERPDGIIPLRNLVLVCIAAQYGSTIGMAATAGDRVLDKSPHFAEVTSNLLSWLWQPQHWTDGKHVEVVLPTKTLTKRQLVQRVAALGADNLDTLARSWSCYSGGDVECGACKPCRRKWVAFAAEGHGDLVVDASESVRATLLPSINDGTWDRGVDEATAVLDALGV